MFEIEDSESFGNSKDQTRHIYARTDMYGFNGLATRLHRLGLIVLSLVDDIVNFPPVLEHIFALLLCHGTFNVENFLNTLGLGK